MEQRSNVRKAVSFDAVIACTRFGMIRGRIVDLAEGGLYIKAETSIVPLDAAVTVTFQPDDEICNRCLSVEGRVVHQSLHGFGIRFDELDPACNEALGRLLPLMPDSPRRAMPVLRAV